MNAPDFAIVADDLTGAADSCASLAGLGHRSAVFFEGENAEDGFAIVALDTDSRFSSPDYSRKRVLDAGRRVRGASVVYKKIDSTLRGNVAAEVAAMMEASGRGRAIVAPAFPHAGRMTVGGTQFLRGIPVHETEFARDPKTPVRESHLPTMLSGIGDVRCLSIGDLGDPESVRRTVETSRIVVVDAAEDEHLCSLVRAVVEPSGVLWVGSAGLASALAAPIPSSPGSEFGRDGDIEPNPRGGVLVVVGSLSEVSRSQLRSLGREGAILASVEDVVEDESGVSDALRAGGVAVVHSPSWVGGLSPGEISGRIADVVASLEGCFGSLVMTGGDTAVAVSRRLGATGIEVFGEVEAGVPFGRLIGRSPYRVVTKAGGFGVPDTLLAAARFLSEESRSEESKSKGAWDVGNG